MTTQVPPEAADWDPDPEPEQFPLQQVVSSNQQPCVENPAFVILESICRTSVGDSRGPLLPAGGSASEWRCPAHVVQAFLGKTAVNLFNALGYVLPGVQETNSKLNQPSGQQSSEPSPQQQDLDIEMLYEPGRTRAPRLSRVTSEGLKHYLVPQCFVNSLKRLKPFIGRVGVR